LLYWPFAKSTQFPFIYWLFWELKVCCMIKYFFSSKQSYFFKNLFTLGGISMFDTSLNNTRAVVFSDQLI
jgi:hypothetical protein